MSSTSSAAANHRQEFFLPPLLSPQSSVIGGSDGSSKVGRLPFDTTYPFVPAEIRHGLRTPPKDMSGMSVNPLLASNIRFDTASAVPSVKDPVYQNGASNAGHSQCTTKIQPNSNAPHQKSRSQENTSFAARAFQESTAGCQNGVDESSIVSYLQIPSSINESKGSLAEFAAQITCLFWFETSFTLHYVEESKATPSPIQPLVSEAMPTMGFRKWVVSILSTTQVSQNVILLALMFIYRLKKLNPGVKGKLGSEFRLFTVALMLGNKFLDDNTYTNKTWAEVSGISVQEIHIMEVEFLSNMRYTLYASENEWRAWHVKLGKFWKYFEAASRSPVESAPRVLNPPVHSPSGHPNLPSPPASTHTSPPYSSSHSFSGNTPTHPHPLSMPPYLPSTGPLALGALPEPVLRTTLRKRNFEQALESAEPPAKRKAHSATSSAGSSGTFTPSTVNGYTPNTSFTTPSTGQMSSVNGPRLPLPNLSISTNNQSTGYQGPLSTQLPLPAVSLKSTNLPGVNRLPQTGVLPSLPQNMRFGHDASHASSPATEWSSRRSSYAASAEPSPTSASFPQSARTPTHLSPAALQFPRTSPYKPIRSVNTLLVPPPSASMHNPSQDMSYRQMHYQPLGKPASQSRPGVLPILHHDSWGQPQDRPGDDNTFGGFPEHLRALVSHALPKITVKAVTYPKFDTRGDFGDCVARFREWLQNVVIDLEVSAGTPSPTIDPSVHTVLVGHSMGGLVAAETLLHIIADEPIPPASTSTSDLLPSTAAHTTLSSTSTSAAPREPASDSPNAFMFPYIQGVLAFDTPYLGLSPSLIAHGAESQYRSASSAYSALSDIAGVFGYGASTNHNNNASPKQRQPRAGLPPGPEHAKDMLSASIAASNNDKDAAATPSWQRLGKYAMFAGAAGAVAAGGAAAYLKADTLTSGWNWVSSHLEFVGCLMRGEELKSRLDRIITLEKEKGVGFADLYTVLGRGAANAGGGSNGKALGGGGTARTFCNVPRTKKFRDGYWWPEVNEKAKEETGAHMSMFLPKENPGYYTMGDRAKNLVTAWVERSGGWGNSGEVGNGEEEDMLGMKEVDIEKEGEMDFGVEKEEGVLWGGGDGVKVEEENPWKMEGEGEEGLEGVESIVIERR
ncbi:MAG: hypothetical protein Q9212_000269 [Teloschistes hypoglaucus]